MSKVPFFSICIPNYNYEQYVGLTIESVLKQTYEYFEVIVVDNKSTDNSWQVIKSYAERDSRIRIFQNNYNIGFAPNLQRATQEAKGTHIILLSSDDLMYPEALSTYAKVLQEQGEKIDETVIHASCDQIDSQGNYLRTVLRIDELLSVKFYDKGQDSVPTFEVSQQSSLDAVSFGLKTNQGIGAFLSTCYAKKLWDRVEGYDTQYFIFPDKAFLIKILLLEVNYLYVNQPFFGYRIHNNNQNAKNAGQAALKHQVDGYMRTINFPENDLKKLGFDRADLQSFYIRNHCERHAFIAFYQDYRLKAFKIICFAYASYPKIAVKSSKLWILTFLLLLGPIGSFLFRKIYDGWKKRDID